MIYNFCSETEVNFDFDYETIYHKVVDCVLDTFNCKYDCEVSLLLVDNNAIKEINSETRGIDKPTDVLSFPNIILEKPGNFDLIDEASDCFEPDSGELILGDIVISADKVISQASEYGHSQLREYAFLICHSLLHLLSFDHMTDDEREVMEEYQSKVMEALKILR